MRTAFVWGGVITGLILSQMAWAGSGIPICPDRRGQALPINDAQVLEWKQSTPNQYESRAHVSGPVTQIFADQNGHEHFAIQLGPEARDGLEVIYNQDFGNVPEPTIGDQVEACGDYITSTAPAGPYPESPEGAIIHWVHVNSPGETHPAGFLAINGDVYGQTPGPREPDVGN